jgi:hypothetical protein
MSTGIRLILTDIDGCMGPGEAQAYDLRVLDRLMGLNRRARQSGGPAVTLCTGRPAPYVDAVLQAIDGHLPAICENGAGLYWPLEFRYEAHPALPSGVDEVIAELNALLAKHLVRPGLARLQTGKALSATLYPCDNLTVAALAEAVAATLDGRGLPCRVEAGVSTVSVWLAGVDKGDGARWLAEVTGIALPEMAAVGDAEGDLAFLRLAGFSGAPANAASPVQAAVDYVSPFRFGRGLLDVASQVLNGGGGVSPRR